MAFKYSEYVIYGHYSVACEAWSTHSDHDSGSVVVCVVVRIVTFLFSDRQLLKGCMNFILILQKGQTSLNTCQFR